MADEETSELDYNITFPYPISHEVYEGDFDNPTGGESDQKEPVVILLGWAGCQDKHLSKYSALYDQHRCITISFTPPLEAVYSGKPLLRPYAVKLLELLTDLSLEANPVFLHVFSNGGAALYRYITEAIHSSPRYQDLHIRGCIFDSAPGRISVRRGATIMAKGLQLNVFLTYLATALFICYVLFMENLNYVLGYVGLHVGRGRPNVWEDVAMDPARWPQLFLYSHADELISYKDIEEVIKQRERLHVPVRTQCWDDSPHVQHLRKHREAYMLACYRFIDDCLGVDQTEGKEAGAGAGAGAL